MSKMRIVLSGAAVMALTATAACSGGEDAAPTAQTETPAETSAETPAETAAAPETPGPDSVDTLDGTIFADFTGDATAGAAVFAQCRACHVRDPGVNRTGPSLHNIVGSEAGSVPDFNYSDANASSSITWTPEKLFQYLENPRRIIPGTRMAFRGLSDPQDRADLIAYLQSE